MWQLLSSHDLQSLFDPTRRDAQALLPLLVRRLVLMSCEDRELPHFRMPAGDDVRMRGWDGALNFTGVHPHVPTGVSVWEISTSADPEGTANENYLKRTEKPLEADPATSTFVFVTSRVWEGGTKWAHDRATEARWAGVRVIDGSALVTWLEQAPLVAVRIADALGRQLRGLSTLEQYWRRSVTHKYSSHVTSDLIIGGRTDDLASLTAWLAAPEGDLHLVGETEEEAVQFFAATCKQLEAASPGREGTARVLFVSDASVTEHLSTLAKSHIVVLTDPVLYPSVKSDPIAHLNFLVPHKRDSRPNTTGPALSLHRLRREAISQALVSLGIDERLAYDLATESKGSLQAVLWMVAKPERGALPWASGEAALDLAPLVLAGQWTADERHPDTDLISRLAQRPYSEIKHTLARWSGPGGPLERRGTIWDWKAWSFAWPSLTPALSPVDLIRFSTLAKEVLGGLETPAAAPRHRYSEALRSGLAGSVLFLAVHQSVVDGVEGRNAASALVRALLGDQNSHIRWLSLGRLLPDLAEAAPDEFLAGLDRLLGDADTAGALFSGPRVLGTSPHTYLLWALERIAWSADHFSQVVLAFGALAAMDPGGNTSNRPRNSLRMAFLPWHPATGATVTERVAALRLLFTQFEEVAWKCGASLLPRGSDIGDPFERPRWRDWASDRSTETLVSDYWEFQTELVRLLIEHAGKSGERWATLLGALPRLLRLHPELAAELLDDLQRLDPTAIASPDLHSLGESARRLVAHHECFPEAKWALKDGDLATLRALRDAFLPRALTDRHRWLFEQWPEFPGEYDMEPAARDQKLQAMRAAAIGEVLVAEGVDAVIRWSADVKDPESLGRALGDTALSGDDETQLLRASLVGARLQGSPSQLSRLGCGYVWRKATISGSPWLEALIARGPPCDTTESTALFAQALPVSLAWTFLAGRTDDVRTTYWAHARFHALSLDDCEHAVPELLRAARPFAAIGLLGLLLHQVDQPTSAEDQRTRLERIVHTVLRAPIEHSPEGEQPPVHSSTVAYHIDAALAFVETRGAPQPTVADLEWKWLPFIEDSERGPKALHAEMTEHAPLFVELLEQAYRPEDVARDDIQEWDSIAQSRARSAHSVIESLRYLPGSDAATRAHSATLDEVASSKLLPPAVGQVEHQVLDRWIKRARELAASHQRLRVCDTHVGQLLAYAPADADGCWPCESVRQVLEELGNENIECGLRCETWNRRGVHFVTGTGEEEKRFAQQFRSWSEQVRLSAPRTASVLRRLAEDFEKEARNDISRGQLDEFDR